jgi:hypothetical protein
MFEDPRWLQNLVRYEAKGVTDELTHDPRMSQDTHHSTDHIPNITPLDTIPVPKSEFKPAEGKGGHQLCVLISYPPAAKKKYVRTHLFWLFVRLS